MRPFSHGWSLMRHAIRAVRRHNIAVVAAGIAFYGLLAVFPLIAAITALWGLVFDPVDIERYIEPLTGGLPDEAATIIVDQAKSVAADTGTGISIAALAGLALALLSASRGMRALIDGLNVIYEVTERRGFIRYHLVALGLISAMGLVIVLSLGTIMAVPTLLSLFGLDSFGLLNHLRWPILFVVTVLVLEFLYSYAPHRGRSPFQWLSPAAFVATLAWVAASLLFSAYVRNFASYNETYGSIGAVVILLMWFWLSAFIVLVGAELDAGLERQQSEEER